MCDSEYMFVCVGMCVCVGIFMCVCKYVYVCVKIEDLGTWGVLA